MPRLNLLMSDDANATNQSINGVTFTELGLVVCPPSALERSGLPCTDPTALSNSPFDFCSILRIRGYLVDPDSLVEQLMDRFAFDSISGF